MMKIPDYKKQDFFLSLDEDKLFNLVQTYWKDIIDLNIENKSSPVDWYVPSSNTYFEAKCRYIDERFLILEEKKYREIIKYPNITYINSSPSGIYIWELYKLEEPLFRNKYMEKSQQFAGKGEIVPKSITELDTKKALQIDHLLIQYT